ncbi:MAG: nodulation protein NfeD [Rhodocyclales bacterium]|nr:nodulation protein NfeD [Rhodocyclales bacterium]
MRRALTRVLIGAFWSCWAWAAGAPVVVLTIDGAIGAATAVYLQRGIGHAAASGAQLVVLQIDTPGGLDVSMRSIVKDILAAPVPVVAYVAPRGARAASAGTFILYASHVAAMAPATNLGAATPVTIGASRPAGGDKDEPRDASTALERKQVQDAVAYLRGLAQLRGRNEEWAQRAVLEAASLPAAEALRLNVIDLIAEDVADLLRQLHGRRIAAPGGDLTLDTAAAPVHPYAQDWRTRLLVAITNPSVAYLLLLVGFYAIAFEFFNPGLVLPGVAGAICVFTALYAFQLLPVNYAGLALILLGLAFMAAEAYFPAYGSLGIGGVVAFVIGSVILIDSDLPALSMPKPLIGGVALASLAFVAVVAGSALQARGE